MCMDPPWCVKILGFCKLVWLVAVYSASRHIRPGPDGIIALRLLIGLEDFDVRGWPQVFSKLVQPVYINLFFTHTMPDQFLTLI